MNNLQIKLSIFNSLCSCAKYLVGSIHVNFSSVFPVSLGSCTSLKPSIMWGRGRGCEGICIYCDSNFVPLIDDFREGSDFVLSSARLVAWTSAGCSLFHAAAWRCLNSGSTTDSLCVMVIPLVKLVGGSWRGVEIEMRIERTKRMD